MHMNPLVWLQTRLVGGPITLAIVTIVYSAIMIVGASLTYSLNDPRNHGEVTQVWLVIVAAAQAIIMLLAVPSAVRKAVLRDHQSGMIESHRLSPMSSLTLVVGYLLGSANQMLLLFAINVIAGSYFALKLGATVGFAMAPTGWWFLQFCIICLSFMLSCIGLSSAIASAGKANIIGVIIAACAVGGWGIVGMIPGFSLVLGIMGGSALISAIRTGALGAEGTIIPISCALQLAIGGIFMRAACRKIRAPERPSFSVALGLLLTVIWGATLLSGLWLATNMPRALLEEFRGVSQSFASGIAFNFACLVPLFSAAAQLSFIDRAAALGQPPPPSLRPSLMALPAALGIVAAVVILAAPSLVPADHSGSLDSIRTHFSLPARRLAIAAAMILGFWTDLNLLYRGTAVSKNALRVGIFLVLASKLFPFIPDFLIRVFIEEFAGGPPTDLVSLYTIGFSPIGTMILAAYEKGNVWPGLIGQVVITAGATWWAARARNFLAPEARPIPSPAPTPIV